MFDFLPFFTVFVGFIITFISGYFVIPFLKKLKFGQTIREEGPKWHESKSGTPTMGGIMFFFGLVIAII
ncbi:MAG: phospho-N-acetylmuramoyl-pentapeptide-transferase, partial [Acutalibacteraceae bacterium]|nr:phospho-N-acetylmuramoyl-pentapeptide-transferase [Acutalibacteraceae bacterium]